MNCDTYILGNKPALNIHTTDIEALCATSLQWWAVWKNNQLMSSVEIYSASVCPYAQRSRMVLLTKGVDFQVKEIDLQNKPDWFQEISPYGKVPLLKHNDAAIWESAVINEYLEEVFPTPSLLPEDPQQRALARIWIDFANTKFTVSFYKLLLAQEPEKQQEWREELKKHLLFMEDGFQSLSLGGPYWLGEKLTLVDLSYAPWFERLPVLEHYRAFELPEKCQKLKQWWQTMQECEAVKATLQSPEFHIQKYSKYASNSASGVTAQEMRKY